MNYKLLIWAFDKLFTSCVLNGELDMVDWYAVASALVAYSCLLLFWTTCCSSGPLVCCSGPLVVGWLLLVLLLSPGVIWGGCLCCWLIVVCVVASPGIILGACLGFHVNLVHCLWESCELLQYLVTFENLV